MASRYILLLLPTLICARIQVKIVASYDEDHNHAVNISGSNVDTISDVEKSTFGLTDEALKGAVEAYFGRRPDDAYLKSPTPWGDLYRTYGWSQVTRTLTPQKAEISEPEPPETSLVLTQTFHNNSTQTAEIQTLIRQAVQNTASSTWEKSGDLTVGQDIQYDVNIDLSLVSSKTSFSYSRRWGESSTKSQTVNAGSDSPVTISLDPDQSVIAELYATRGFIVIEVEYEASLNGSVAVNYDDTYRGHHFWSLDAYAVMKAGDLKRSVKSKEIIKVGYYVDARLIIADAKDNSLKYYIPMKVY